jgi:hypothetical protein
MTVIKKIGAVFGHETFEHGSTIAFGCKERFTLPIITRHAANSAR